MAEVRLLLHKKKYTNVLNAQISNSQESCVKFLCKVVNVNVYCILFLDILGVLWTIVSCRELFPRIYTRLPLGFLSFEVQSWIVMLFYTKMHAFLLFFENIKRHLLILFMHNFITYSKAIYVQRSIYSLREFVWNIIYTEINWWIFLY